MYFATIYIPSYPEHQICTNYRDECPMMTEFFPAACAQTLAWLPGDVAVFPKSDQVIFSFDLGAGPIQLSSPPKAQPEPGSITLRVESQCPYGSVVPDDPTRHWGVPIESTYKLTNHAVIFLFLIALLLFFTDTGCSVACPTLTLMPSEYDTIFLQRRIAYWFALLVGALQLLNLSILKRARLNVFVVCAVIGIFTASFLTVLQIELFAENPAEITCSSNASW
jgi:hypothetical protein